jgi:hypothetical protein
MAHHYHDPIITSDLTKLLFESQESIDDPLNGTMFSSWTIAADGSPEGNLEFQNRRLLRICKSSVQCDDPARPAHEAEWNKKVTCLYSN